MKKLTFEALVSTLQTKYPGTVFMGSDIVPIERVPTGYPSLDSLLSGGWPKGRIVEICGPSRTGKTTLALVAAKTLVPCLYIDADRKFDPEYAATIGVDLSRLIVLQPETLEDTFSVIFDVLSQFPLASIVLDSLPALIPTKEILERDMSKTTAISPIAVMLSRKLPIVVSKIQETGTVLLIVNQVRDKINAAPFTNPYNTPGGHQLKALETFRIVLGNKGQIKDSQLGVIGQTMALMIEKSSLGPSMQRVEMPYINGLGFVENELAATNQLRIEAGKRPKREVLIEEVSELDVELQGGA